MFNDPIPVTSCLVIVNLKPKAHSTPHTRNSLVRVLNLTKRFVDLV